MNVTIAKEYLESLRKSLKAFVEKPEEHQREYNNPNYEAILYNVEKALENL